MKRSLVLMALLMCAVLATAQTGAAGGRRGGQRGGGQFGGRRGGGGPMQVVMRKDVQTDLAVTDDQKTKLTELQTKQRDARRAAGGQRGNGGGGNGGAGAGGAGTGGGFDQAALAKRMQEQNEQAKKDLSAILNADQMKRLDEIGIQLQGSRALSNEAIQKQLGLSADQISKIKDLNSKQREANTALNQKRQNNEITQEDFTKTIQANTKALDEAMTGILSSEQNDKFKAMQGRPFKADPTENGRAARGGGGGRRGGGGAGGTTGGGAGAGGSTGGGGGF